MLILFTPIKYLHILLAITAVGFNASYGIWIARAAREPAHLAYTLRGVKFLDDRVANPAYVLLLITGLSMVVVGSLPLTTLWIDAALVLYVLVATFGLGFYTPTLRRQIQVLEEHGADSDEYQRLARRGTQLGIANAVLVILIVFMMVFKPGL